MNRWLVRGFILFSVTGLLPTMALSQEGNVDEAREALARQEGDEDSSKQLEEVFQAAETSYSLQKKGTHSLNYSFDVVPSATHNFTNAFSYDYGLLDNLTVGARIPLVVKYDTQDELNIYDFGDISATARWQPFAYVPGKMSTTVFGTFTTKTGVSPYEIDIDEQLSTGSGYYSVAGGVSFSKVLDPVVVFGSTSATYNLPERDLQQVRGARVLQELEPGFGLSGSAGFAYSLSYDISLSISAQLSYSDQTILSFSDGTQAVAQDQMSGFLSMSLGTRVSDTTIVNTSLGIGLTEDAPDFSLGVSLPIRFSGLKE